jgi:hypothetical protein
MVGSGSHLNDAIQDNDHSTIDDDQGGLIVKKEKHLSSFHELLQLARNSFQGGWRLNTKVSDFLPQQLIHPNPTVDDDDSKLEFNRAW